jgi:hypothetical protein
MYFWDGTNWAEQPDSRRALRRESRAANWAATGLMLLVAALFLIPFSTTFAATKKSAPSLSVGCGSACLAANTLTVGSDLAVHGTGFTPSSGGQQVILWVGYPDNYCSGSACHGFYADPWVADDGSFSVSFDNATLQAGTGTVKAIQYNARTDKWVNVASVSYTVH